MCSVDLTCSTNFLGVLKWRSHTGQNGRHSRLHIWMTHREEEEKKEEESKEEEEEEEEQEILQRK